MLAAEIRTLSAAGRPFSGACYFIVFFFLRVPTPLNLLPHRVTEDLLCNSHIQSRLKGKKKKSTSFSACIILLLFYFTGGRKRMFPFCCLRSQLGGGLQGTSVSHLSICASYNQNEKALFSPHSDSEAVTQLLQKAAESQNSTASPWRQH